MPTLKIKDYKFSQNEVNEMMKPLELDLIAYYKTIEEVIFKTFDDAIRNNLSPEDAINEIEKIFDEKEESHKSNNKEKLEEIQKKLKGLLDGKNTH